MSQPPTKGADRQYQKIAQLRRADCAYEQANYGEAIAKYQAVANRWPDEPVALAACVQVVNAFRAMNRPEDAKVANERVRTLLAKMPQGAFADSGTPAGGSILDRTYWEQWLKFSGTTTASAW